MRIFAFLNLFSCQVLPKRHIHLPNLQISVTGLFKSVCPFVKTRHERVKNYTNMIFSALWIFLMFLRSESKNGPISNL